MPKIKNVAARKARSLKKIGELIKAGIPFNASKVSFDTLQVAQNMGKVTKPKMLDRPEAGGAMVAGKKLMRKKTGYR